MMEGEGGGGDGAGRMIVTEATVWVASRVRLSAELSDVVSTDDRVLATELKLG